MFVTSKFITVTISCLIEITHLQWNSLCFVCLLRLNHCCHTRCSKQSASQYTITSQCSRHVIDNFMPSWMEYLATDACYPEWLPTAIRHRTLSGDSNKNFGFILKFWVYCQSFQSFSTKNHGRAPHRSITFKSFMLTALPCIDNSWRSTTLPAADLATSDQTLPLGNEHQWVLDKIRYLDRSLPQIFQRWFSFQSRFHCLCKWEFPTYFQKKLCVPMYKNGQSTRSLWIISGNDFPFTSRYPQETSARFQ